MQEEVKAIVELKDEEIEQVSGAGAVGDAIEGALRTVTNWVTGGSGPAKTPVCCGLLG